MKQLSLRRLGEASERALRRFPLVLLAAVVAAVAGIALVSDDGQRFFVRLLLAAQLGIPAFLVAALTSERTDRWPLPRFSGAIASLVTLALLVVYGATRSGQMHDHEWILQVQLTVGLHLLVAVLPFAGRGETRGMWQFNIEILLRFITAVFFSAVLFGGLSLALYALDELLGVNVDDDLYFKLWIAIAFVFNTAYFLGGVPARLGDLDAATEYPRVLRIFAQYILAPLVLVYLAILTAYFVKVVATTAWPSGWIGYLVSSVAAVGLGSLLLLKPESERDDRRWVRTYARVFHLLMLPAVAMLALAVLKRVGQYGVTENRYFLLILTAWLAVVVVVGCFRRHLLVKAIPASLAALAFLTAIGLWSAWNVSYASQRGRLEHMLDAHGRLVEGVIVASDDDVEGDERAEISAVLRYLFTRRGADALGDLAGPELQVQLDGKGARNRNGRFDSRGLARITTSAMNLKYEEMIQPIYRQHYEFNRDDIVAAVPVTGWDYYTYPTGYFHEEHYFEVAGDACSLKVAWDPSEVHVIRDGQIYLTFSLEETMASLKALGPEEGQQGVLGALLDIYAEADSVSGWLRITSLSWSEDSAGSVTGGEVRTGLLLRLLPGRADSPE